MRQLVSGKVQALVAAHQAVHEPSLRRLALIVNFDAPAELDGYLAAASRAGPAGGSCTLLTFLTLSQAALAGPLAGLLQVRLLEASHTASAAQPWRQDAWHTGPSLQVTGRRCFNWLEGAAASPWLCCSWPGSLCSRPAA